MDLNKNRRQPGTKAHRSLNRRGTPLLLLGFTTLAIFLLILIIAPGRRAITVRAQEPPDPRFGIVEAFWAPEEAAELNVGWERILFYWREIQPTGPDDWNTLHVLEEWLAQANSSGRTVVGLIKNTPPWASEDGTEAGIPKGLYLDVDDPDNLWAEFVRKIAAYYSIRNVHHWIIWNEPEIPKGVYGYEFAGTTREYYRLLKVAYQVIKEVDPDSVVHLAGLTWWHDQEYLDRLFQIAREDDDAEANEFFFDVISLHLYFRSETVKTIIDEVNKIQEKYGFDKPIWLNETNAPPNKDPEWPVERPQFEVDLDQQSWFIAQSLALGFAAGAQRISVYKLLDIHLPPGGESFGLLRPDFSQRPAYLAYMTAISSMEGFTGVFRQQAADYFVISFQQPGRLTRVLWARTPSPINVSVPALADSARLLDVYGEEIVISALNGDYSLHLEAANCPRGCIIGGSPIYLVESIEPNQESTIPTASVLEGETVTPLVATITPSRTAAPTRTLRPTKTNTPTTTPTANPLPDPTEIREITLTSALPQSTLDSLARDSDHEAPTPEAVSGNTTELSAVENGGDSGDNESSNSEGPIENESNTTGTILLIIFAILIVIFLVPLIRKSLQ